MWFNQNRPSGPLLSSGIRPAGSFLVGVSAVFAPVHLVFPAYVRGIGGAGFFAPAGFDIFVFMVPQVAGGDQFAVGDPALGQEPFLFPLFETGFFAGSQDHVPVQVLRQGEMFSLLFSVPIIAENRPAVNGSGLKEENRPAVPGG